ncbi:MAG: hypothetical protein J7K51_06650 [Thermotogae bacterium]|nr:hypothetical protein [Thermotogota bacterium]
MFISFVLIQVKRTKEKIKTSTGQFSSYTIHSCNRRDGSLPPVRFARGE